MIPGHDDRHLLTTGCFQHLPTICWCVPCKKHAYHRCCPYPRLLLSRCCSVRTYTCAQLHTQCQQCLPLTQQAQEVEQGQLLRT